jgi:hypothetical protein
VPSTKFLFWNIARKPLAEVISSLAEEHRADVVILAECSADPVDVLRTLNNRRTEFHIAHVFGKGIRIFTRFSREFFRPVESASKRFMIGRLLLPARSEILVSVVHLPSKLYFQEDDQSYECRELAREIAIREDQFGHRRTVVVGDFNMNPFERGLVGAGDLHAVMLREVADRESRTVQERDYRFFYNPMWNHFGDAQRKTAGSYYYADSRYVTYFWNMFDQVLIRPELARQFDPASLKIVTSFGAQDLVRENGRPDSSQYSDHLPIVFELAF